MQPRFSIIMQSHLGPYKGAASNREQKILRAIDSVLNQSFTDWELIIVADGCEKTYDIVEQNYSYHLDKISCTLIEKQTQWSGAPRNYGLSVATGDLCVYLDIDDMFGLDHLQTINNNIAGYDWAYFNDFVRTKEKDVERNCMINVKFQHGTSNIVHKRSLGAKWTSYGYGLDDHGLVLHLLKLSKNYNRIATPQYITCHVPTMMIDA